MCESVLCLICALLNNMVMLSSLRGALTDTRFEVPFLDVNSIACVSTQSQLCLCLSHSSSCACRQADFRAGRSAQVELHRDDGGPSEERDEEGGVVTLGASAGRCPGPAAAEVANQDCSGRTALVKEPSACAMGSSSRTLLMAVCLRY